MVLELGDDDGLAHDVEDQYRGGNGSKQADPARLQRRALRRDGAGVSATHATIVADQRRSSRCLQATSSVAIGNALSRAFGIGLPQLSQ